MRGLCEANYVNNPQAGTMDGSWLLQACPGGACGSGAFGGTRLQCQGTAVSGTITICPAARAMTPRMLGDEPGAVRRSNAVLSGHGTPGSGIPGWRDDAAAGFIEIGFTHSGGRQSLITD